MTTLALMKARIARDIFRDDLTDAITDEITSAIGFYRRRRFWFNETRTITFNTVEGQEFYTATDHPDIPNLLDIDYIQVSQSNRPYSLWARGPEDLDIWTGTPTSGVPTDFVYFQQQLRFYPAPNGVYPVRISAVIRYPAPASDAETDNPWMTDGEELIRSRAKRNLYLHTLGDQQSAAAMKAAEDEALMSLQAEASRRQNIDTLCPSPVM